VIFVVPVLTMRLFSEEKRSGTLEVLLTVPLEESSIVLSKFFASIVLYMVVWVPWLLYLVGLRVIGGEPFDYRPAISFFFALACCGAGFLAMGLFFSSLTRNQIAAAILTFMGMMLLLGFYILSFFIPPGNPWYTILNYVNFLVLWRDSLTGKLEVRALVFWVSTAVFWLFLTIKVLEARKWS
jgi:ABC-2 type transport system permease protein